MLLLFLFLLPFLSIIVHHPPTSQELVNSTFRKTSKKIICFLGKKKKEWGCWWEGWSTLFMNMKNNFYFVPLSIRSPPCSPLGGWGLIMVVVGRWDLNGRKLPPTHQVRREPAATKRRTLLAWPVSGGRKYDNSFWPLVLKRNQKDGQEGLSWKGPMRERTCSQGPGDPPSPGAQSFPQGTDKKTFHFVWCPKRIYKSYGRQGPPLAQLSYGFPNRLGNLQTGIE